MLGYLYRLIVGYFTACNHKKWIFLGKPEGFKNNVQRCSSCGFIQEITKDSGKKNKSECKHSWNFHKGFYLRHNGEQYGEREIHQCIHCKEYKHVVVLYDPAVDHRPNQQ